MLDFVSHRPDMPIYPGGPKVGLGLWNSFSATVIVETIMFAAGLWIYVGVTRARDAVGRWALWSLIAILVVAYVANALAGPPPSVEAIWVSAIPAVATLTGLAWWADAHRDAVPTLPWS